MSVMPDGRRHLAAAGLGMAGLVALLGSAYFASDLFSLPYGRGDYADLLGHEALFWFSALVAGGFFLLAAAVAVTVHSRRQDICLFIMAGGLGTAPELLFSAMAWLQLRGWIAVTLDEIFFKLASLQGLLQWPGCLLADWVFGGSWSSWRWSMGLVDAPVSVSIQAITELVAMNTLFYCVVIHWIVTRPRAPATELPS